MTKQEVSQRVLLNGNPLDEALFTWDKKTNTFSSNQDGLVLDFKGISNCTFKTGYNCTFKTSYNCTFDTSSNCTFKTGSGCTFKTSSDCTFDTSSDCTFKTGSGCTFKTSSDCTFKTGSNCTFDTGSDCTFKTGSGCTFKTSSDCTFDTGSDCTFKTGSNCTFKTSSDCTFKTGSGCTFKTESNCVIVRRDTFEVIVNPSTQIKLCPYQTKGYLIQKEDGRWYKDDVEHIIVDGILSKVISHKGNVYKVINHGEENESYIVTDGTNYSHGETLKEAKESLIYKISDRDTSDFKDLTIDSEITFENAVKMYRKITGACEGGVKGFISTLPSVKEKYTIKEIIELTEGRYNNNLVKQFFKVTE